MQIEQIKSQVVLVIHYSNVDKFITLKKDIHGVRKHIFFVMSEG